MTCIVMASGPSMCQEDADTVKALVDDGKVDQVIVVNTTFRLAPWAGILYTNDHDWLDWHLPEIGAEFFGDVWCGHPDFENVPGIAYIPFDKQARGLFGAVGHIAWGMNSGGAALSLAAFLGHKRIVLLGYDQQWHKEPDGKETPRWHGRHPEHLQNQKPGFHRWGKWFAQAAKDAEKVGIEIINCSRETSLTCFKRMSLHAAFDGYRR